MVSIRACHIINFSCLLVCSYILVHGQESINKLPHCIENSNTGLILVSTLDGKVSALNTAGILSWQIDTGPGSLLNSNIHNLELTNNGQWIRIIPSLSGSLYKFDGANIDAIPIHADGLLKSSFRYSDDLVIAGGLDVRTYGVGINSGTFLYECSTLDCKNMTDNHDNSEDVAVIERSTRIVRAIEPRTGMERWNFSVGQHNIKIPHVSCMSSYIDLTINVTANLPDGIVNTKINDEKPWQYKFDSPVVNIWQWNGDKIKLVNLFKTVPKEDAVAVVAQGIYLGMHNKQLYIHESTSMQTTLELQHYPDYSNSHVEESHSLTRIPFKPVPANELAVVPADSDPTAMAVLYGSEYVNGNGYYLYAEKEDICGNSNSTFKLIESNAADMQNLIVQFILFWWKEVLVIMVTTIVVFNYYVIKVCNRKKESAEKIIYVERHVEVPAKPETVSRSASESSDSVFSSRFMNDFDTVSCLGKGGFGVVFEAKQKIDECIYAIKRITLPIEEKSKDRVMREVKALAKLDHHNIVRYFNSWVEHPPSGWHIQHDQKWIPDGSCSYLPTNSVFSRSSTPQRQGKDVVVDVTKFAATNTSADSFIVFEKSETDTGVSELITSDMTGRSASVSEHARKKINWRRPSRRPHSLDMTSDGSVVPQMSTPVFLYIQMQLCKKESLKDWLNENKVRPFDTVLNIFRQILAAVEYVHMQGLIHRDLKPSNIFFSLEGQIKVGDFGLVTDMRAPGEKEQTLSLSPHGHTKAVGTRLYMSPEQMKMQRYNYKVDIYSLGLIFFELLVPFDTEMERVCTLFDVREKKYPSDFLEKYAEEHKLLDMMLCDNPHNRPTTMGIRARPPLKDNCPEDCHFELPLAKENT